MAALTRLKAWLGLSVREAGLDALEAAMASRRGTVGSVSVTQETALRHSAVWACIRLRADLISTLPVDVFRRVGNVQVEVAKPPLLRSTADRPLPEWLYSSQVDLDRYGNAVGIITEVDSLGFASRVDLVSAGDTTMRMRDGQIVEWKIGGKTYTPKEIWHERQFTVAGSPMGLCPVAYAAYSIGGYLSAQQFALDYFAVGGHPSGTLRHTTVPQVDPKTADGIKARFKAATSNRDIFVTGRDWEYTPAAAPEAAQAFLEEMKYGVPDVCRFFGVPADLIDGSIPGSAITYANVTQRNLQFLIMNLGPAVIRRETALSAALPAPRFVKFNTDALLRLDPAAASDKLIKEVAGRLTLPSEARALMNRAPYTDADYAEFDRLWPQKSVTPVAAQPSGGV